MLSIGLPSGFALSQEHKHRLIHEDGHNVWTTNSEILFFFEKVLCNFYMKFNTALVMLIFTSSCLQSILVLISLCEGYFQLQRCLLIFQYRFLTGIPQV